ncbi:circadian clock protein KaiC [Saccharopolyspora shandongensis]|uniref:circadian clock protein KaiC n=1 Tax=Saccharopolyspora shandongensis TaxID=418495 RepID=UPI0034266849
MTGSDEIERIPTGIGGFDQVALGGLPAGRSTLVTGTTGSGKTLFAVEFLARGVRGFDDAGVFVTFEETPTDIRRNAASLGFPIEQWEGEGRWAFVDASADIDEASTVGSYDFNALVARIEHVVRQIDARRVSLDSLGVIFTRFSDIGIVRHELFRIACSLEALGVTSVLTAERTAEHDGVSRYGVEEFVLNNVIILRNALQQERRRRTIEIVKFRGAPHRTGEWLFAIDPQEGIVVMPLAFLASRERASQARVSSGNVELDEMCGGGFYRDAIVLLSGSTGAGKTLTSLFFAASAFAAGERCLFYTFDETREQLARNAAGWGLDLDAMEATGLLRVVSEYPEVASLEDHFIRLRRSVAEFAPARMVIDTLSALERIATPRAMLDFLIALGAVLRPREITALLTSAAGVQLTPSLIPADTVQIASLADVTILLRDFEHAGEIQRAIAVVQFRGTAHDHSIRQVTIDNAGMHIGVPLRGVSHIFAANPVAVADPQWPTRPERPQGPSTDWVTVTPARARRQAPSRSRPPALGFATVRTRPWWVEASADGIVAVDERGIIRLANPAAEMLFARATGELVGSAFGAPTVVHQTSEIDLIRPDGRARVVEMRVTATTLHGEHIYVAALRDVTRRKQVEQDLEVALERQTTVAAHELRTPVAAIKLLVHLLRDRRSILSEEQTVEIIDQIVDHIDRLQALMHKLLTASKIDAEDIRATPEPVRVLETLLEQLAGFGEKAQDVSLSCSPELVAFVDRHELFEMLTNYLENAFAYGCPPIEVRASEQAGWVEIRVCDRGPGVPDAFVPLLFERFSRERRARQQTEGTGLGLWIVHRLAQAAGGDAWYEPNDDEGACFCLRLQGTPNT